MIFIIIRRIIVDANLPRRPIEWIKSVTADFRAEAENPGNRGNSVSVPNFPALLFLATVKLCTEQRNFNYVVPFNYRRQIIARTDNYTLANCFETVIQFSSLRSILD